MLENTSMIETINTNIIHSIYDNDIKIGCEKNQLKMNYHKLENKWILWSHLPQPQNNDWSIESYKKIYALQYVEDVIYVIQMIPDNLLSSCCFFIMKENIIPMWEDLNNREGGCFSYIISNKIVNEVWKNLSYSLTGETLSNHSEFNENVNGISISPKKNFCVIKIWMKSCLFQNPELITSGILPTSINLPLFRINKPEF